jgi:hypothetical protein
MKNKKKDDGVFSFTLIDLLVQIIFLGIFVFAIKISAHAKQAKAIEDVNKLKREIAQYKEDSGKYHELTDRLTTLSPNYIDLIKNLENKKKKGGIDKPSCLFNEAGELQRLSTVHIVDDRIVFQELTPDLDIVLKDLNYTYENVKSLSGKEFVKRFSKIKSIKKDCVYYMAICEKTKDLSLRDAIEGAFYKILTCDLKKGKT